MQASASLFGLLVLIGALAAAMPLQQVTTEQEPPQRDQVSLSSPPAMPKPTTRTTKSINRPRPRIHYLAKPDTTDGAIGISFQDLAFAESLTSLPATDELPESIRNLVGKRVAIRGFIEPTSAPVEKGLTQFILAADDQYNSFMPSKMIDQFLVVQFTSGRSTDFTVRPIVVVGKLGTTSIRSFKEDEMTVFRIEAESAALSPPPAQRR